MLAFNYTIHGHNNIAVDSSNFCISATKCISKPCISQEADAYACDKSVVK